MSTYYLSRRKIATRGGLSANTLKNYADRGIGPEFVRLPTGACRYDLAAFDAWLTLHTRGGEQ